MLLPSLSLEALIAYLESPPKGLPPSRGFVDLVASADPGGREHARELLDLVLSGIRTRGNLDFTGYQKHHSRAASAVDAIKASALRIPAPDLVLVIEVTLPAIESALLKVGDSTGGIGSGLERLERLHQKACSRGGLNPLSLGDRPASWNCDSAFSVFRDAASTHGKMLGKAGLAVFLRGTRAE